MPLAVVRRSAGRHTITPIYGQPLDLSRFFTVTRDNQGLRADRAGEFQRSVVNPINSALFGV